MDTRTGYERAATSSSIELGRSSSLKRWMYDVFLSFRGEDTRNRFMAHLHEALVSNGINTFIDDRGITRGEVIKSELKRAIQGSRISVIVFSARYADSSWCLDELVIIMECREKKGQKVLPIFYDVDPSDVRKQTGAFATAFHKYGDTIKARGWRAALNDAANLAGEDMRSTAYGNEAEFMKKIISEIDKLLDKTCLSEAVYPVGIDSRVQRLSDLLDTVVDGDVGMVGIWGMGGIGKTTVAKALFNKLSHGFLAKSFLPSVNDTAKQLNGLVHLQEQLLSETLKSSIKIGSVAGGINEISRRLRCRKVLVLIDDIAEESQLDALARNCGWFGPGSRIIITTRNKHLLSLVEGCRSYPAKEMNEEEALDLFTQHSFRNNYPSEEYIDLSKKVVKYCSGLPLALEVLGSFLRGRSITEWEGELDKLKAIPPGKILETLKMSYDGLPDRLVKAIFLDISCFFVGMEKTYAMEILDARGFYPGIGINVLLDRCLVTVERNSLMMHDLVRDMGREIVCAESDQHPEERSRLWRYEDVKRVLRNKSGTEKIEGLFLGWSPQCGEDTTFSTETFIKMQRLRLLKLHNIQLTGDAAHFPKELIFLHWTRCLWKFLPKEFNLKNLVSINMRNGNLIQLSEESDVLLEKLKVLDLSFNRDLRSPDFSKFPNLEMLALGYCKNLSVVHHTIVQLRNLKTLFLADCNLTYEGIPEDIGGLSSLETLNLRGNYFSRLPILSGLSKLVGLGLDNCTKLQAIPDLPKSLEILMANDCTALERMPTFSEMSRMRKLHLNHSPKLLEVPGLANLLYSMEIIDMKGCTNLTPTFKESILQGWSTSGYGGIFLPGTEFPPWFKDVGLAIDKFFQSSAAIFVYIEMPESFGCNIKALTVCIIYSSEDPRPGEKLYIRLVNRTHRSEIELIPMEATATTPNEDYLWLGHISNNEPKVKGGDKIIVCGYFSSPTTDHKPVKLKKLGVSLEQEKVINEYPLEYVHMPYSGVHDEDINWPRPSHGNSSDEEPSEGPTHAHSSYEEPSDSVDDKDDDLEYEAWPSHRLSGEKPFAKRLRFDPPSAQISLENPETTRADPTT